MPFARQKAPRAYKRKPDPVMTLLAEAQCKKDGCDYAATSYEGYCQTHQCMSKSNPRVKKNWYLLKKYGITIDQFDAMRQTQDYKCGVCRRPETESFGPWKDNGRYGLAVDHNHTSGAVRELLCPSCNTLVAQIEKDPMQAIRALEYLERHGSLAVSNVA